MSEEQELLQEGMREALQAAVAADVDVSTAPKEFGFEGVEGVEVQPDEVTSGESSGVRFHEVGDDQPTESTTAVQPIDLEMAIMVISGALSTAVPVLAGVKLDGDTYDHTARCWAVVLEKRFPDGGLFRFLAPYKEELLAGWATITFVGAIREARKEKQKVAALKEEKAKKAEKAEVVESEAQE
ncbi:MAG: hypothetical protein HOL04_02495 [Gammaproteobacteria bacterium]|jgi:hypothetical protein|nr:hypothetical protein [Gammaproteobacteria bacterium]MBT4608088.1 hypothetical protein [Thiotrichales bacterium]MBT3967374.1 hypothetical protein [Gammaproteobacteria bacterium]MBT4331430.1 hypothetical protein [Gammaproteobacteria bacterium]MBT4812760.1 hypothetical protein [Thiotrichales bacterium]